MKLLTISWILIFGLTASAAPPKPSQATAWLQVDPVARAMEAELKRSVKGLKLPGYKAPYYIGYRVLGKTALKLSATSGAIFKDALKRTRKVAADVRVGSYRADSSEDVDQDWTPEGIYMPSSDTTIEGVVRAIRHTLWLKTDVAYKQALSSYLKLKGQRVFRAKKRKRPSFSRAKASVWADKLRPLSVDRKAWRVIVKRVSAELATDPAIFDAEVEASFAVTIRYFANSEGARLRTVWSIAALHITAYSRAKDGMIVDQSREFYAPTANGLPKLTALIVAARNIKKDLAALRVAPVMPPYTGPAILEPAATGVFFHEVLGHRLEGHRQDKREEGQTFRAHLGKKILPSFLSVIDDPTRRVFQGTPLNGFYRFDAEGVPAQRVVLVDRGVLKRFLMSRRPVEGFRRSNGHGRAASTRRPVARMGNLIVQAHRAVSMKRLREMLLAEVKRQKKPHGLIVRGLTGGRTNTSSYGFQAFKGLARMVYTVDAKTGTERLVRGVDIVGTPLTSLGKVMAAGRQERVFNGYCGAESGFVPVSAIGPATLFREIELQRTGRAKTRGPILRNP